MLVGAAEPTPPAKRAILLPGACGKPQHVEKPQGWNKPTNSFRSTVRNSTRTSGDAADAPLCPRGCASPMLGSCLMPSLCLVAPVDPQISPSRTQTCWDDVLHSESPGAWHRAFAAPAVLLAEGERGTASWAWPPVALRPLHQEGILEHCTQAAPEGSAGRESTLAGKDWDFPAYPAFTELHIPLCLRRDKLG